MAREINLEFAFCPKCKEECSILTLFCPTCGTKIIELPIIVCLEGEEGEKIERILLR